MVVHFFLNSLLVFIVLVLLIEFILFVFRIRTPRTRCLCRALPLIKLPVDFVFYHIFGYAESFFINLNPFSCEVYLQKLILSILPNGMKSELSALDSLIIPQYISMQIPACWLSTCIIAFFIISALLIMRKLLKIRQSTLNMTNIFISSLPCTRDILNEKLKKELVRTNTRILTSTQLQIPIAAYKHYILVPKSLENDFSQEEFEAVIAHELEHLRWKDPIFKLFFNTISTLFWWIPTIWWLKRLEEDQEQASDSGLLNYDIQSLSLASALIKVLKKAKELKITYELAPICSLNSSKSIHVTRFENLVNLDQESTPCYKINEVMGGVLCLLACISFWMC